MSPPIGAKPRWAFLARALGHQARADYCLEAAEPELLIAHRAWLHRDFTSRFVTLSRGLADGQQVADRR